MFASMEDVIERFARLQYIASRTIGTVVYLATHLKKPVLVMSILSTGIPSSAPGRTTPRTAGNPCPPRRGPQLVMRDQSTAVRSAELAAVTSAELGTVRSAELAAVR